jgi:Leucine-rich repeat (LRR) protein
MCMLYSSHCLTTSNIYFQMASFTWKYQILCLLSLLLHSQVSFPSSFSSSLSSMSPCFALLQFNKSFSLDSYASAPLDRPIYDMCEGSYPKTASWMEDKECCSWDGVECDKTTGHVIGLDLGCSWLKGSIHSNSSLFFLRHLRRLNLAGNYFNDSLLPSEFGKFKSLTHLNLSFSNFFGQIPYEISQLSSLVSLDLSYNWLLIETLVWKRVVDNLTQLRELLLDQTDMSSIRSNSLMNLSSSLTTLSLHYCGLQGKLQDNILCLPSLQTLNLGGNWQLEGSLPMSNWSSSLKFIVLTHTSLSGELPDSIGNLKSLKYLNLLNCNFIGSIPASIRNLTQITSLDLSLNNFIGSIPASLGNLTQITYLDLSHNNFTGSIPASLGNLTQITSLDLSYNNFSSEIQLPLSNFGAFQQPHQTNIFF